MSLRFRIIGLTAFVMLFSIVLGTVVAGLQTRAALHAELAAGQVGAGQTVRSAFEDLPHSDHPDRDLHQLTATFDGNRHVQAVLLRDDGTPVLSSQTSHPVSSTPPWFAALLHPAIAPLDVPTPSVVAGYRAMRLIPVPEVDVADAWREFSGVVGVLCATAAAGLVLVYAVITAAFRPLDGLSREFARIGAGDYSGRVKEGGPLELLVLQRGFNHMAEQLAVTTARNRQLGEQFVTIQEEERADIARDLHDEFGPHLFAVNMDAEIIVQLLGVGRADAAIDQARSIQEAIAHMQRQVRDLLGRLRPTRLTALGLSAAIEDLVRFWSTRRDDIVFELNVVLAEDRLGESVKDIAYRLVQEAVNNAVRHGDPSRVYIRLALRDASALAIEISDNGGKLPAPSTSAGFGLVGMRERVEAAGGTLAFGPSGAAPGWVVVAAIPIKPGSNDALEGVG